MKYRMTYCQDEGFTKHFSFFIPIDLRKKHYFCHHCQKYHLTKEGIKKPKNSKIIKLLCGYT
jgi:hypothetical protein